MAIAYRQDIEYDPSEYEQCIACGAYDVPDPRGRCQYCGARLPSSSLDYSRTETPSDERRCDPQPHYLFQCERCYGISCESSCCPFCGAEMPPEPMQL